MAEFFLLDLNRQGNRPRHSAITVCFLAFFLFLAPCFSPGHALAGTAAAEIVKTIKKMALNQPSASALAEFGNGVADPEKIRALLASFDHYASYMTEEETSHLADLQTAMPMAIGADIVHDREKRAICIPYADSPAARAGIRYKDELLQVDGYLVSGLEVDEISSLIRGEDKGPVLLQVRGSDGNVREVTVERARVKSRIVDLNQIDLNNKDQISLPRIQIYRFTSGLSEKLGAALQKLQAKKQLAHGLIIDLRGNTGGSFDAAETCAAMLLPKGAIISRTVGRDGSPQVKRNQVNGRFQFLRIYIWQDDLTASAAEVFLAALEGNRDTLRIGSKTFGKARIQSVLPLSDGSLLKLTTAKIMYPNQEGDYQDIGFLPHVLVDPNAGESAYVKAMEDEVVFVK